MQSNTASKLSKRRKKKKDNGSADRAARAVVGAIEAAEDAAIGSAAAAPRPSETTFGDRFVSDATRVALAVAAFGGAVPPPLKLRCLVGSAHTERTVSSSGGRYEWPMASGEVCA